MTYCVWMRVPHDGGHGWSRVAGGLTQEFAEQMAEALFFPARAMPDRAATRTPPFEPK